MTRWVPRVALVTGGGTGLGRGISLALARNGTAVAVNYSRSSTEAMDTVTQVRKDGGTADALRADVSRSEDVKQLVSDVVKNFGRLDALVNAAGVTVRVPFKDLDGVHESDWDRIMAVNVRGTWLVSSAVAPLMSEQGEGAIVNVASTAGIVPGGSSIPYSVSKAAVAHLTRCLAVALAPTIRVNAVAPGFMDTRWNVGLGPEDHRRFTDRTLLGRLVPVDDVASAVIELMGNTSLTGQVWPIDGGFTAR
jgi:3-oxoacyl-[acyl-carrier protein] reductase